MDSPITFTILTAIKNGFSDFAKTYPTVLAQTKRDFEWIIVDDGSDEAVSERFPDLARDPRVRILRHSPSMGQTKSLNEGIRAAKGAWIVRMDGDDLCAPDRLERIAAEAEKGEAELIFSDYLVIDGEDRAWAEVKMIHPLGEDFFRYLQQKNNPLCHPTVAFHRTDRKKQLRQFREDLVNAQDYALWKQIHLECGASSFVHLPYPTIRYRIARDSLSGARAPEQRAELKAIRAGAIAVHTNHLALRERQKEAMQNFRLIYYRFVGLPCRASFLDDLFLFGGTAGMPRLLPKALFFLLGRPFRKFLLPFLFGRIYE